MKKKADEVTIYEVGPRDGLQNEPALLPAAVKIELIERLVASGLRKVEAASFVSPEWVPQMADAYTVYTGVRKKKDISYPVLVPNEKGMELALEAGVQEIALFSSASESFSRRNTNASIDKMLERYSRIARVAKEKGIRMRGYVSCISHCPYEGDIAPDKVAAVASRLYSAGCYEIALADTTGTATPRQTNTVIKKVLEHLPVTNLALHCHDTYGLALTNIYEALQLGIRTFDTSVAGLGGCPYAPGAAGNVATEDVIYFMEQMSFDTGIDMDKLVETAQFITDKLKRPLESKAGRAWLAGSRLKQ